MNSDISDPLNDNGDTSGRSDNAGDRIDKSSTQTQSTRLMDVLQEIQPTENEFNDLLKPENWPVLVTESEEMFHSIPNLTFSHVDPQGNIVFDVGNTLLAPTAIDSSSSSHLINTENTVSEANCDDALLKVESDNLNTGNHNDAFVFENDAEATVIAPLRSRSASEVSLANIKTKLY